MAEIELLRSHDPVGESVRLLGEIIRGTLNYRDTARLAIPGGSALNALGGLRAQSDSEIWGKVWLTWVDERQVPPDDLDSNCGEARRRGFLEPAPGFHLPLFLDGEKAWEACARVEASLQSDFQNGLDVSLLGLGEDGHIASLFPERAWSQDSAVVFAVSDSPKLPSRRITLSLPFLRTASNVIFLVRGESKRDALNRLLEGDDRLPGSAFSKFVVVTDLF